MSSSNATTAFGTAAVNGFHHVAGSHAKASNIPATIFAAFVVAILTLLHRTVLEPLLYGKLSHVPGPKLAGLSWYYMNYFDLCLRRDQKISEWHWKYGPVVRIRPNEVTLGNPTDYREIYDSRSKYDKTKFFKCFAIYGEDNLFSTEKYTDHQAKKRKIAFAYARTSVVANAEDIVRERVSAFIAEISAAPNGLVDFFVLFDCFSHDVMTRFLYGVSHSTNAIEDPKDRPLVVNLKRSQVWTPLFVNFGWLHGSWLLKLFLQGDDQKAFEYGGEVKRSVERRMLEHDEDPNRDAEYSLYRTMRQAKTEGDHLSRNYMASEMYDHLKAGQQTIASTLTYLAWRLSRQSEWQQRLQDELKALRSHADGRLSLADVEACPILEAVIKETLRLHPAASGRQERVVPAGGRTYSSVYVPGGTTVIGPTLVLHHDLEIYNNPLEWRPERWLDASHKQLRMMEFSFVPFGHGARICIGQHLAMMEIRLLTASIYQRFSTTLGETCTDDSMHQLGTLAAVPRGLRCELYVSAIKE